MSSNINKSEKMVSVVADTIAIDYAEELRSSGMSKEQVRREVVKYIRSPDFIEAVQRRVDEIISKFDDSVHCSDYIKHLFHTDLSLYRKIQAFFMRDEK